MTTALDPRARRRAPLGILAGLGLAALSLGACDQLFGIREGHPPASTSTSTGVSISSSGSGGAGGSGGLGGMGGACASDPCCSLDCLGGECKKGQCQPIILASSRTTPTDISLANGVLYWIEQGTIANNGNDGAVYRAPVDCKTDAGEACITTIAQNRPNVSAILASDTGVFWSEEWDGQAPSNTGTVWEWVAKTNMKAKFAVGQSSPRALAIDPQALYWANAGNLASDGEIRRRYLTGGTPNGLPIVTGLESPLSVLVDADSDSDLFWTTYGLDDFSGSVGHSDTVGQQPTKLLGGQGIPRRVAITPTHLYWVNYSDGTLMQANRNGSKASVWVTDLNHPSDVKVVGHWVVWTETGTPVTWKNGRVAAKNLDTSELRVLADGFTFPYALAYDDKAIYWVSRGRYGADDFDGSIAKVARP